MAKEKQADVVRSAMEALTKAREDAKSDIVQILNAAGYNAEALRDRGSGNTVLVQIRFQDEAELNRSVMPPEMER